MENRSIGCAFLKKTKGNGGSVAILAQGMECFGARSPPRLAARVAPGALPRRARVVRPRFFPCLAQSFSAISLEEHFVGRVSISYVGVTVAFDGLMPFQ